MSQEEQEDSIPIKPTRETRSSKKKPVDSSQYQEKSRSRSPKKVNASKRTASKKNSTSKQLSPQEIIDFRANHINLNSMHFFPNQKLKITKTQGVFLIDENKNQYLDCINNASHAGHCTPYITNRVCKQLTHLNTNSRFLHDEMVDFTKKFLSQFPKELCVLTFVNTGTEANDLAMQMARYYTQRKDIVCVEGAYHGMLGTCLEVSPYKWNDYLKQPDTTIVASSPCQYRGKFKGENSSKQYAEELQEQIKNKQVAAFISESLQSCSGQIIPNQDYFKEIYRVIKENGGICIADECQSYLGRVGEKKWGFELFDVIPDIVTIGKSLGNGIPVGAVVCTQQVADNFKERGIKYFNTFGGNAVSIVSAHATLDYILKENLQENSRIVGAYALKQLQALCQKYENIGDVRGKGLFIGIDIVKDKQSKQPHPELCEKIVYKCLEKFVILQQDGIWKNIIKIKPPLIFDTNQVDRMVKSIDSSLQEILQQINN